MQPHEESGACAVCGRPVVRTGSSVRIPTLTNSDRPSWRSPVVAIHETCFASWCARTTSAETFNHYCTAWGARCRLLPGGMIVDRAELPGHVRLTTVALVIAVTIALSYPCFVVMDHMLRMMGVFSGIKGSDDPAARLALDGYAGFIVLFTVILVGFVTTYVAYRLRQHGVRTFARRLTFPETADAIQQARREELATYVKSGMDNSAIREVASIVGIRCDRSTSTPVEALLDVLASANTGAKLDCVTEAIRAVEG